ncbi:MAG: hypothetical protein KDE56_03775 [Anaerolineales bacterium]|nr:hypothetical protein [Anaerolineales bacterium]
MIPTQNHFKQNLNAGVPLLAVAYSLSAYFIFQQGQQNGYLEVLSVGFICVLPFVIGPLVVWFAPSQYRGSVWYAILAPGGAMLLFVAITAVFLGELWVCIFMASPIALGLTAISGLMTNAIRRQWGNDHNDTTMNAIVLFLLASPFAFTPLELQWEPLTAVYRTITQIHINATPDEVWQQIIRVPQITPAEQRRTLFHLLGVPQPLEAQLVSEGVGGQRYGLFAGGLLFDERITAWEPARHIAFNITPRHTANTELPLRQIGGQVYDIRSAAYTIEPLADGGVMLHLDGTYSLTSHFNGYGRLWMDVIMRDFQNYVLQTVQQRAEAH